MRIQPSLAAAVLAAVFLAAPPASVAAPAGELPAVIQTLQQKGLGHVTEFEIGPDLRGFAGVAGGQPVAIYVTPDGNAIVGSRIDAQGAHLDATQLDELVAKPMSEAIWKQLEGASWVPDGKSDAPRVVYTFTDANCPYCHKFWEAARPWVDAGQVQLRHVMVGVVRADSSPKAAAILSARDPTAALLSNEHKFDSGGIKPAPNVPPAVRAQLDANQRLMAELGFRGTPGIVYQDEAGMVQRVHGLPQGDTMNAVMGPM